MNEESVRRILSEKKEGFNVEAGGILHDVKYDLECQGITNVRVINRYDVSGITDEEYEKAKNIVVEAVGDFEAYLKSLIEANVYELKNNVVWPVVEEVA